MAQTQALQKPERKRTTSDFVWRPRAHEKQLPFLVRRELAKMGVYALTPITTNSAPGLHALMEGVSHEAGLPMPQMYYLESDKGILNAMVPAAKKPMVLVSRPLTKLLTPEEMAAVLAHETGHAKHMSELVQSSSYAAMTGAAVGYLATSPARSLIRGDGIMDKATHDAFDSGKSKAWRWVLNVPVALAGMVTGAKYVGRLLLAPHARTAETASDWHSSVVLDGREEALVSALDKLTLASPHMDKHSLGFLDRIKQRYKQAIVTHKPISKRAADLGVSPEKLVAYQQSHANDPTVAEIEAGMPLPRPQVAKSEVSAMSGRVHTFADPVVAVMDKYP